MRQELLTTVRRALLWTVVLGLGLFALLGVITSHEITGGGAPFFLAAAFLAAPPIHAFWKRRFVPSRSVAISCILILVVMGLAVFGNATDERLNEAARREGWLSAYDKNRALRSGNHSPETWAPQRIALDQRERNARAAAAEAKRQEEAECQVTLRCWAEKNLTTASSQCREPVERLARFSLRWVDKWYEPKFSHYKWAAKEKGIITYLGDRLEVQNVFGAWQPHIYECDFDPAAKQVIAVRGYPGRF